MVITSSDCFSFPGTRLLIGFPDFYPKNYKSQAQMNIMSLF